MYSIEFLTEFTGSWRDTLRDRDRQSSLGPGSYVQCCLHIKELIFGFYIAGLSPEHKVPEVQILHFAPVNPALMVEDRKELKLGLVKERRSAM